MAGDGRSPFERFSNAVYNMVDTPVTWFRGSYRLCNVNIFLNKNELN